MAQVRLGEGAWSALRFQVAFEARLRRIDKDAELGRLTGNWFAWSVASTLRSSCRPWTLEEISDHLKCSETEAAAAIKALRRLRLVVVATTPSGGRAYALSSAAESQPLENLIPTRRTCGS